MFILNIFPEFLIFIPVTFSVFHKSLTLSFLCVLQLGDLIPYQCLIIIMLIGPILTF